MQQTTMAHTSPALAAGNLGIDGLPDDMGKLPHSGVIALAGSSGPAFENWRRHLVQDLCQDFPTMLVAPDAPLLDRLFATQPDNHTAPRPDAWVLPSTAQSQLQEAGFAALHKDLKRAGLKPQQALCLLDASPLFTGASLERIHRLAGQIHQWASQRKAPVILCFEAPGDEVHGMLTSFAHAFPYYALLKQDGNELALSLERWNSAQGAVFAIRLGLQAPDWADTAQRLHANGVVMQGASAQLIRAPDELDVYATQAAVADQRQPPASWHVVDTRELIPEAVQQAIGATVLLDAGSSVEFEALARMVHQLRCSHPQTLKIVVRETVGKLRLNSEQALLRLGANDVIYRELSFSRLLQRLRELQSQRFSRQVPESYEQALDAFLPIPERGYQQPAYFCALTLNMLRKTQPMGLSHSLIQLRLLSHASHIQAIEAYRPSRDGDLITADHDSIYVFLFACGESDIDTALPRLFLQPLAQLFSSQTSDSSHEGMLLMLGRLQSAAEAGLPDYTAVAMPGTTARPPIDVQMHNSVQPSATLPHIAPEAGAAASASVMGHSPIPRRPSPPHSA